MKSVLLGLLLAAAAGSLPLAAQAAPTGLQPGDAVRLKIWREPDLSGEFQVDERGEVVFPQLGAMRVSQLSADSLKSMLVWSYTAYLRDPSIEVTLLRRVNVLGPVRSPGLYQVDQTQTIADVLAQAGGATPDGKPDRVELVRGGDADRHPPQARQPTCSAPGSTPATSSGCRSGAGSPGTRATWSARASHGHRHRR